jgi:carbonic anhydrase
MYDGYKQFQKNILPQIKENLKALKIDQKPKALFITCSDSRICPNELTSTKQGELFVIRNAGNTIPSSTQSEKAVAELATVEYAVKALKVKEIVICGHTHCAVIKAMMDGNDKNMPFLTNYFSLLGGRKKSTPSLDITETVKVHVQNQIKNLKSHDFIKDVLNNGNLNIYGWVYNIETGDIEIVQTN